MTETTETPTPKKALTRQGQGSRGRRGAAAVNWMGCDKHAAVREKYRRVRQEDVAAFQERVRAEHPDAEFLPYSFAYRVGHATVSTGYLPSEDKFSREDTALLMDAAFCPDCKPIPSTKGRK